MTLETDNQAPVTEGAAGSPENPAADVQVPELTPEAERSPWHSFLLVLVSSVVLFSIYQHDRGLWSSHEARAGQIARNMIRRNDYTVQYMHTQNPDYQKPPLYYWCVCLAAKVVGMGHLAVRAPVMVSAILLVLALFWAGNVHISPRAGLVTALVAMTSIRFWWLGHVARIDMLLTMLVTVAGLAFYTGYQSSSRKQRWLFYLVGYAATGLGVLAKGPLSVVLGALGIGLLVLLKQDWREIAWLAAAWIAFALGLTVGIWQGVMPGIIAFVVLFGALAVVSLLRKEPIDPHIGGVLLFALITIPHFVVVDRATNGEFTMSFFVHHNLIRFTGHTIGEMRPFKRRPVWFYVPHVIVGMLPWTICFLASWRQTLRKQLPSFEFRQFILLWTGGMFLFLSLASFKRPDYVGPLIPGFALLTGWYLAICWDDYDRKWARMSVIVTGAVFAVLAAAGWGLWLLTSGGWKAAAFTERLFASPLFEKYFNSRDLHNTRSLAVFVDNDMSKVMLLLFCLVVTAALVVLFRQRERMEWAVGTVFTLIASALLGFVFIFAPAREQSTEQITFSRKLLAIAGQDGRIVLWRTEAHDILFYLDRWVERFQDAFPDRDLSEALASPDAQGILFLVKRKKYEAIKEQLPPGIEIVLENPPGHLEAHLVLRVPPPAKD